MATILLLGVDLYVRGKLEAVVPEHRFQTADGVEPPDLVIADVARIDPLDVTDTYPDVPVLGYTNHTDTAGLRGAHAAGFDQVVAKSALFERTRELIDGLLTTVE
jgi:DNA-binding NarL/FixJ family response regulator